MSSLCVSYEVWNNGRLAANQFAALAEHARTLPGELSKVARLWQEARDQYGDEFPAWSYGDSELPDFVVSTLIDRDLARLVAKVKRTKGFEDKAKGIDPGQSRGFLSSGFDVTAGATRGELKSVFRKVSPLESFVGDLAERVDNAQREYEKQVAFLKMRASLRAFSKSHAAASGAAASSAAEEEEAQRERDLRRCAEEASRLLETLAAEVAPRDRTAIEQRAQEAVESPQASRRRALLAQLRLDIQRANAAGAARQRRVAQVEQWRQRLLGLEGPEVEELDAALRQAVDGDGPLPPDMAQKVEDVAARATEASNRAYALGVISEELENLGYVVEAGFETASAQAPEMLLHKPEMEEEYHVSLRAEAGAPFLHNRVVREAVDPGLDSQGPRSADRKRTDERMERAWCEDLAAALAAAEHKGVRGRALERLEPGREPVPTIAPLKSESEPGRKRKRKRTGRLKSRAGR